MTKLCPYCAEEVQAAATKCKHCHSWIGGGIPGLANGLTNGSGSPAGKVRLTRSTTDRKISGICGGLARLLRVDSTIVRVGYVLASLFSAVIPGIIVYAVLSFVIPSDDDPSGLA